MIKLYHFWSSTPSARLRLALNAKQIDYQDISLDYWEDETFFELGVQRQVPVLSIDGQLYLDSEDILWQLDALFPDTLPLVEGKIDLAAWQALLQWRESVNPVLARLYAPLGPAYRDIGGDEGAVTDYKARISREFGLSVENLANDRYDAFTELAQRSRLPELAKLLAEQKFYTGQLSIADCLLAADFYPLQVLDGVSLPIGMMYYLQRVEAECRCKLNEGLLIQI